MDLKKITHGLSYKNGIWKASKKGQTSYRDDGNNLYFACEDKSFWFTHRNTCILYCAKNYPPSGFILDIGGGNGIMTAAFEDKGFSAILLEPQLEGTYNAQKRGVHTLISSTFREAKFLKNSVPAVGMFDVLEHIEDPLYLLNDVLLALKPGGIVYLTVPAMPWLWSHEDVIAGHYCRYSKSGITKLLEKNGFKIIYSSYLFSYLLLPLLFFKSIPTKLGYQQTSTPSQVVAEHCPGTFMRSILTVFGKGEEFLVKRKWRIPFGTTCLVVAQKSKA